MDRIRDYWNRYREQIRYLIFGGLTTLVNIVSFDLLDRAGLTTDWANGLALAISIAFAYVTNRIWVFQSKARGFREVSLEMLRFFGARGVSFFLDLGCMYVGVDLLHINDTWMKLLANILVIIANYVFSKVFVFRKGREKSKD